MADYLKTNDVLRVLHIAAHRENRDSFVELLQFHSEAGRFLVYADCSDVFDWASADAEPIATTEDVDLLARCVDDLWHATTKDPFCINEATDLYAARRRRQVPMDAYLRMIRSRDVLVAADGTKSVRHGTDTDGAAKVRRLFEEADRG